MDAGTEYRQASAQGLSKVRIVVALYGQIAQDLSRAISAVEQKNIEGRSREIDHALVVLEQLQGRLDYEGGREIARNLERFYRSIRMHLLAAHMAGSAEILREQIQQVLSLRDAWLEIARIEEGKNPGVAVGATATQGPQRSGWEA
jgi:flagellar protein FliS